MTKVFKIQTKSAKETQNLAGKIADLISGGEIILLEGDLGGGKTTFTQGLAKALKIQDNLTSPTFVLKKIYPAKNNVNLEHLDLYRLAKEEILADPTLLENFGTRRTLAVVEWGEKIQDILQHYLVIKFNYLDQSQRELNFLAYGAKEQKLLKKLKNAFNFR